jgi:membrane protease YdiL (CAAX protease family)
VASASIVLAGVAILAARPFVDLSSQGRVQLFVAAYVVVGLASLSVPVPADRGAPTLAPATALVAGLAAVGIAAMVAGPPVPSPWAPATLPVAAVAAVAEEALFRRAAYGRLIRLGAPVAVIASAALFALVHLPAYGVTALPVDLGAGLLLSWQRWACGRWTVPAATHVAANLLAAIR